MPMTKCGQCGKECFISDHMKDCGAEVYCGPACAGKSFEPVEPEPKITLRDKFAMAALTGLLASPCATQEWITNYVVGSAYTIADAMLKARKS